MVKFSINTFGLAMILSLVLVTIISYLLSTLTEIPILRTGPAFLLLFASVFIIYLFVIVKDAKLMKGEIFTMIMVALALVGISWGLKTYMPEIFSILPESTREVFSAIIP